MTTKEKNKLIDEFMGAEKVLVVKYEWFRLGDRPAVRASELRCHSSWDWLMPVVEKIENLGYSVFYEFYANTTCYVNIRLDTSCNSHYIANASGVIKDKINVYLDAVVQFIQYYNQQKQQP